MSILPALGNLPGRFSTLADIPNRLTVKPVLPPLRRPAIQLLNCFRHSLREGLLLFLEGIYFRLCSFLCPTRFISLKSFFVIYIIDIFLCVFCVLWPSLCLPNETLIAKYVFPLIDILHYLVTIGLFCESSVH